MSSMLIRGLEHLVASYDDETGVGTTLCGTPIGPWHVGPRAFLVITCPSCNEARRVSPGGTRETQDAR